MKSIFILAITIAACTSAPQTKPDKIEAFVADFAATHKKAMTNEVLTRRVDGDFEQSFLSFLSQHPFDSVPLKLVGVKQYGAGKYAAHLQYSKGFINSDIIGIIDSSFVNKLSKGNYYVIKGNYQHPIHNELSTYTDHYAGSDRFSISDSLSIQCGTLLYDIEFISPVTGY